MSRWFVVIARESASCRLIVSEYCLLFVWFISTVFSTSNKLSKVGFTLHARYLEANRSQNRCHSRIDQWYDE